MLAPYFQTPPAYKNALAIRLWLVKSYAKWHKRAVQVKNGGAAAQNADPAKKNIRFTDEEKEKAAVVLDCF